MKIVVVCDVLGEENNGTTVATMNFIRHLKKKHDVKVLCADEARKGQEGFYVVDNLHLGKLLDKYIEKVGVTLAKSDKNLIIEVLSGADHVHIMLPFFLGVAACNIAKKLNIPITAGFHMQAENFTSHVKLNRSHIANHMVYKVINKILYSKADGIHFPTKFIKDMFERHVKYETNGYVISNGVNEAVCKMDVSKPLEYKDKIVILSVGRYAREKSQDTLIKAIAKSKHKSNIKLILAGQGPKYTKYKKLADRLGVDTTFKLMNRQELTNTINFSDIYVHSAEIELEGIACLEAIVCGKLTIVSNSKLSATKNFAVSNECMFKNRCPYSLAKRIDFFIENPNRIKKFEALYLEKGSDYKLSECMDKMEKMILDVQRIAYEKEDNIF